MFCNNHQNSEQLFQLKLKMSIKSNNKTRKAHLDHNNLASTVTKIILSCISAGILRYLLMVSKYQALISSHQVSTPLNSWKRVSEGLFLLSKNMNPYDGDLLHETPLALAFYKKTQEIFGSIQLMFIGFDLATGLTLYFVAKRYVRQLLEQQEQNKKSYAKDVDEYLLKVEDCRCAPLYVLLAFLFNPYTFFNCVGCCTTVFHNFFLALFLFGTVHGNVLLSATCLALCASVSLYPFILVVPACIYFTTVCKSSIKALLVVIIFVITLALITVYCSNFGTDFSYIRNVYGCILSVPDLQPNIGLFWYFFTEMFEHFRELFIYSFQINATILYLVPLSIKFRGEPFLLTTALLFLVAIFKSYPSIGDVGFVLSLLPCFVHLFAFCQQGFLVGVILLIATCLGPILWQLWIYCNSANANFYFGVTLAFAIAQIFLVTDILFAQIKRNFALVNGKDRKIDGEDAILSLE